MSGRIAGVVLIAFAAFALAADAEAGVQSSQSAWYAGNPPLGPNDLEDVACGGQPAWTSLADNKAGWGGFP